MVTIKPSLGIWRATSLVTGNIIGAGLFMMPASLGAFGTVGLMGLALTSLGALCLAFVFAWLSQQFPKIGGPYAYNRAVFGDFIGFQTVWGYWIGTWASVAAIALAFVSYLSVFLPELNDSPVLALLISLATIWIFTFLNISGIKTASTTQIITTVLKLAPLTIIGFFGLPLIQIDHFFPINPSPMPFWSALVSSAALTLFSFVGLESATIPAADVDNPEKTIPRATMLGTLLSALVYIVILVAILGILSPHELANSSAPFVDAGAYIFGSWAGPIIASAAIVTTLGTINGLIMIIGQMPVAAARDGLFPLCFDRHNAHGSPHVAILISSILMSILLVANYEKGLIEQFNAIIAFVTFTTLTPYLFSTIAALLLLIRNPQSMGRKKFICFLIIMLIACIFTIVITIGAGPRAVFLGTILIFAGFPFFVLMKRKQAKKAFANSPL